MVLTGGVGFPAVKLPPRVTVAWANAEGVAAKAGGSGSSDLFAALTELVRGNSQNIGRLVDEHVALAADLRVVVARVREATENGELATLLDNGNAVAVVLRRELPHILDRTQTSLDDLHVLASSLKSSAIKAPEIVAQGYELYVIASAVVGGASLIGGKGSALGAMLGALLIVLIRQSIRTLHLDQNYEWIVIGCAIIIAVVVDQWSTRAGARRLALARETLRPAT